MKSRLPRKIATSSGYFIAALIICVSLVATTGKSRIVACSGMAAYNAAADAALTKAENTSARTSAGIQTRLILFQNAYDVLRKEKGEWGSESYCPSIADQSSLLLRFAWLSTLIGDLDLTFAVKDPDCRTLANAKREQNAADNYQAVLAGILSSGWTEQDVQQHVLSLVQNQAANYGMVVPVVPVKTYPQELGSIVRGYAKAKQIAYETTKATMTKACAPSVKAPRFILIMIFGEGGS